MNSVFKYKTTKLKVYKLFYLLLQLNVKQKKKAFDQKVVLF